MKYRYDSAYAHAVFSRLRRGSGSRNLDSCAEGAYKVVATQEEGAVTEKRSSSIDLTESTPLHRSDMCLRMHIGYLYAIVGIQNRLFASGLYLQNLSIDARVGAGWCV